MASHRTLVLILILAPLRPLVAQWPAPVDSGARVQVWLPEKQYQIAAMRGLAIRGRVAGLTPDTLYVAVADSIGPVPIPRQLIKRLEYSRGVPSRFESGVRRGVVAGIGTALLLMGLNQLLPEDDEQDTGDVALVGAGIGLFTGGLSGALYPRERWKRVKLD